MAPFHGLMKEFVQNLQISDSFAGLPYTWNPKSNRLELKCRSKIAVNKLRLSIGVVYLVTALMQIIWTWKRAGRMVMTHSAMFVADYVTNISSQFLNYVDPEATVDLFNKVIQYEETLGGRDTQKLISKEKKRKFTKFLMQMMAATGIFMPPLYHLDILRNPCFPMYVGYWLSDQCGTKMGLASPGSWSLLEFGTKALISLISYLNWSFVLTSHCFHTSTGMVLLGHCIRSYISKYGNDIRNIGTVDEDARKKVTEYRAFQVLAAHHRSVYSAYFLSIYSICMTVVAIVCLYSTIMAAYEKESVQLGLNLLYFWCTFVTAFILVFIIGILADVYRVSKRVNQKMNGQAHLKRNKWYRKFSKASPRIRIYIGGSNFFDELTPLTLESFAITQTINLLLLK
ncbi:unnamed protein product [Orchesella dallaii]|uniref:Odorant receptor n=1 Tax=Orchesella dallaii TaxID=48710 RepID=A0ABP1RR54_9HEXA